MEVKDSRPVRQTRHGSVASDIREWVFSLPEGSAFYLADVPAAPRAAARVLHDLVRDHYEIERIFKGFYWRGSPLDSLNPVDPPLGRLAMAYAGAGSGYAGATAVNRLGWTTQVPVGYEIGVVGRAPQPGSNFVRFSSRSNRERLDLTWAEITLLEGVLNFHLAEAMSWDDESDASYAEAAWAGALEELRSGWSAHRLGPGAHIRTKAVLEAAPAEPRQPAGFLDLVEDLAQQLPDAITTGDGHGESTAYSGFNAPALALL
ncbi:hypothetical protein [Candidatus Poriferisocius sp.]|uniref:hypothetical protein n=1 Tax=Candidatus Poriferisocius sp. TaxID=3101276 RepID=UPI003B012C31